MIVSLLLLILHKKYSFISLCLKPEKWQKVAKFKGAEYFRKALYLSCCLVTLSLPRVYVHIFLNYLMYLHINTVLVPVYIDKLSLLIV